MDTRIGQAIIGKDVRYSPDFPEAEATRLLCERFGGTHEALFAQPLGRKHAAVVRTGPQGCRVLAVPLPLWKALEGDLFALDEAFPPAWDDAPTVLEWTMGALPSRTVRQLERILNTTADRSQALLGGTQALLDGGRLVFVRPAPDPSIIRDLWALLPGATRAELWPSTFAPKDGGAFHLVVAPTANVPEFAEYVREEGAQEYPEGRYEYSLQAAVESGDQEGVDRLLSRQSRGQMFRLAVILLVVFLIASFVTALTRPEPSTTKNTNGTKEATKEGKKGN